MRIARFLTIAMAWFLLDQGFAADWPPPMPAADPQKNRQQNLADLLGFLHQEALRHDELLLLARHFGSLELLVREHGAAGGQIPVKDAAPLTSADLVDRIYEALTADWEHGAASWQAYLDGRPMMFAWRSPYDGNISVEAVTLPKDYRPGVAYPLYFELHAISPSNKPIEVLRFASGKGPYSNASLNRPGLHVYPWARGLTEYHQAGQLDLWEGLALIDATIPTDPARQYLYGFSMGAGGTWNFGAASIQRRGWAALGIFSGTTKPHPFEAAQLGRVPVWLCYGEKEGWRRFSEAMYDRLVEVGNTPERTFTPGGGHNYKGEKQDEMFAFLASKTNPSPVLPRTAASILRISGDDQIAEFYLNGTPIALNGESVAIALREGENVVACRVRNRIWSGGLRCSLSLPDGHHLRSDGTWKCVVAAPSEGWSAPGFDDGDWPRAQAMCTLDQAVGHGGREAADAVYAAGTNVIGAPATMVYRTVFDSAGGKANALLRGKGFSYRMWLNGALIGEADFGAASVAAVAKKEAEEKEAALKASGKPFKPVKPQESRFLLNDTPCETRAGRNVIVVEIRSDQPRAEGNLWKFGLVHREPGGTPNRLSAGPGWRFRGDPSGDGWTQPEFDDRAWPLATAQTIVNAAYDGGADMAGDGLFTADFVCPSDLYFRKTFTVRLPSP